MLVSGALLNSVYYSFYFIIALAHTAKVIPYYLSKKDRRSY